MTYKDWLQIPKFYRTRFGYVPVSFSAWNLTVCYSERPVTEIGVGQHIRVEGLM